MALPAIARPTLWDRARTPRVARAERALVAAERMLMRAEESGESLSMSLNFTLAALAIVELAGGAELGDPRLAWMTGRLLATEGVGRDAEAVGVLEPLLAAHATRPEAARGWHDLARAFVRLGKVEQAVAAFLRALALEWEPEARSAIHTGLGRAYLVLQNMSGALSSFRQSLALATERHVVALAHYDIAASLERMGDLPGALRAARAAVAVPLSDSVWGSADVLDWPIAAFHPAYELHYRAALGAMALGEAATDVHSEREHLAKAVDHWNAYLRGAERARVPWVRRARRHRDSCRQRLQSLAAARPHR